MKRSSHEKTLIDAADRFFSRLPHTLFFAILLAVLVTATFIVHGVMPTDDPPSPLPQDPTTESSSEEHVHVFEGDWTSDASGHRLTCECGERGTLERHIYGEWMTDVEPTYTEGGTDKHICTVCGYCEYKPTAKIRHDHVFDEVWSSDGAEHWHGCTFGCGERSDAAEHTFDEWVVVSDATEALEGLQTHVCTVCGFTASEAIPQKEHEHIFGRNWIVDETSHWRECTYGCGERSREAEHDFSEWETVTESTETEPGSEKHVCTVCGYEEMRETALKPHEHLFESEWITTETTHWRLCECGVAETPEKHTFGEWYAVTEATVTEEGVKARVCTVCGYTETGAIPVASHLHVFDEGTVLLAPSEYYDGVTEYACTVCGYTERAVLPAVPYLLPDGTAVDKVVTVPGIAVRTSDIMTKNDGDLSHDSHAVLALSAAQLETESALLRLSGVSAPFTVTGIKASDLIRHGGQTVMSGSNVTFYRVLSENEAIVPFESDFAVGTGETATFLVSVHVPEDSRTGVYVGSVTVTTDAGDITVPLKVRIYGFEIGTQTAFRSLFDADALGAPYRTLLENYRMTAAESLGERVRMIGSAGIPTDETDRYNADAWVIRPTDYVSGETTEMHSHGVELWFASDPLQAFSAIGSPIGSGTALRLLPWLMYDLGIDAYFSNTFASSDGLIVSDGGEPTATLALERLRDGAEDYDYLYLYEKQTAETAKTLGVTVDTQDMIAMFTDGLYRDTADYTEDARRVLYVRNRLAELIAQNPDFICTVERDDPTAPSTHRTVTVYAPPGAAVSVNGRTVGGVNGVFTAEVETNDTLFVNEYTVTVNGKSVTAFAFGVKVTESADPIDCEIEAKRILEANPDTPIVVNGDRLHVTLHEGKNTVVLPAEALKDENFSRYVYLRLTVTAEQGKEIGPVTLRIRRNGLSQSLSFGKIVSGKTAEIKLPSALRQYFKPKDETFPFLSLDLTFDVTEPIEIDISPLRFVNKDIQDPAVREKAHLPKISALKR